MASTALDGGVGAVFGESREDDNRVKVPHLGAFQVFRWHSVGGQSLLYPGGGVGVWKGVVVAGGGESVEGMKRLHTGDSTGDHGDGVGSHQRDVVRGTAKRQRVIGWAGGS